jgi:hypothetical protein
MTNRSRLGLGSLAVAVAIGVLGDALERRDLAQWAASHEIVTAARLADPRT